MSCKLLTLARVYALFQAVVLEMRPKRDLTLRKKMNLDNESEKRVTSRYEWPR